VKTIQDLIGLIFITITVMFAEAPITALPVEVPILLMLPLTRGNMDGYAT